MTGLHLPFFQTHWLPGTASQTVVDVMDLQSMVGDAVGGWALGLPVVGRFVGPAGSEGELVVGGLGFAPHDCVAPFHLHRGSFALHVSRVVSVRHGLGGAVGESEVGALAVGAGRRVGAVVVGDWVAGGAEHVPRVSLPVHLHPAALHAVLDG